MFPRLSRAGVFALGAMMGLTSSWRAEADEVQAVPQPVDVDLKHLATELDLFTAEARRARVATALIGLSIGTVLVPSGLVLLDRTDGISQALVIGMIVGGSAQLASVPLALIPTRMDGITNDLREKRWADRDTKYTVRAIENEWREAAAASRRRRAIVGATMLIVGTASLATGLTFLLAPSGVLGMSRKAQYTWGGVFMGSGIPVTSLGVRFIFEWSAEETSWEAYRNMKADAVFLHARLNSPSFGALPIRGGALAFAALVF
jgi:hypothetical protein